MSDPLTQLTSNILYSAQLFDCERNLVPKRLKFDCKLVEYSLVYNFLMSFDV